MDNRHLPTIEDYLGLADTRFFGAGYRRADYRFGQVTLERPGSGSAGRFEQRSSVTVSYPADWSRKVDGVDLRPHLSTIDVMIIAAQMCETSLAAGLGLDPQVRRQAWLRKVTLRAGTAPQEELSDIPISATLLSTTDEGDQQVSLFACQVGVMRARCEVIHPRSSDSAAAASGGDLTDLIGSAEKRYYGDGFKADRQRITEVDLDFDSLSAQAVVDISYNDDASFSGGIEGAYRPGLSLIDCFVSVLQLAQVLLYRLDGIDRRHSNTLWMLQTTLTAAMPNRPVLDRVPASAPITGKRLLSLNGGTWRNADITGEVGESSCVAHSRTS